MDLSTFQYSDGAISHSRKITRLLQWLLPFLLVIYYIVITRNRNYIADDLISLITKIIIFEMGIIFISKYVVNRLENTRFSVTSQYIERSVGRSVERIDFTDIRSLKILENPSENHMMVTVTSKKISMTLFGVEDIARLIEIIKSNVIDKSIIHEKNSRFVTFSLKYKIMQMVAGAGAVTLLSSQGGIVVLNFVILFILFGGLFLIIYKPLTRSLGSYKIFEVIIGILLILSALRLIYLLYFVVKI